MDQKTENKRRKKDEGRWTRNKLLVTSDKIMSCALAGLRVKEWLIEYRWVKDNRLSTMDYYLSTKKWG